MKKVKITSFAYSILTLKKEEIKWEHDHFVSRGNRLKLHNLISEFIKSLEGTDLWGTKFGYITKLRTGGNIDISFPIDTILCEWENKEEISYIEYPIQFHILRCFGLISSKEVYDEEDGKYYDVFFVSY